MKKIIVGITGASGSIYADKLIRQLLKYKNQVLLTVTKAGMEVLKQESGLDIRGCKSEEAAEGIFAEYFNAHGGSLRYFDIDRIGAAIASGSFRTDGMVILPCSMATVSSVAHGASGNLLERAADVVLKEKGKLILVPREAPFNTIHLQNLLQLSQCGAQIIPASPSFYHNPGTIDELVDFFTGRILDQLGVEHDFIKRWEG